MLCKQMTTTTTDMDMTNVLPSDYSGVVCKKVFGEVECIVKCILLADGVGGRLLLQPKEQDYGYMATNGVRKPCWYDYEVADEAIKALKSWNAQNEEHPKGWFRSSHSSLDSATKAGEAKTCQHTTKQTADLEDIGRSKKANLSTRILTAVRSLLPTGLKAR